MRAWAWVREKLDMIPVKFSLPSLPKLSLPKLSLAHLPKISLPKLSFACLPELTLPKLSFSKLSLPKVSFDHLPKFSFDHLPKCILLNLTLPNVSFPKLPKLSLACLPKLSLPMPSFACLPKLTHLKLRLSKHSLLELSVACLPKFSLPKCSLPTSAWSIGRKCSGVLHVATVRKRATVSVIKLTVFAPPAQLHAERLLGHPCKMVCITSPLARSLLVVDCSAAEEALAAAREVRVPDLELEAAKETVELARKVQDWLPEIQDALQHPPLEVNLSLVIDLYGKLHELRTQIDPENQALIDAFPALIDAEELTRGSVAAQLDDAAAPHPLVVKIPRLSQLIAWGEQMTVDAVRLQSGQDKLDSAILKQGSIGATMALQAAVGRKYARTPTTEPLDLKLLSNAIDAAEKKGCGVEQTFIDSAKRKLECARKLRAIERLAQPPLLDVKVCSALGSTPVMSRR